jgi:chromosomal replication initiation ATPase DnaA
LAYYIEGDSNKLPRSVGLSIAEHPNTMQLNPMFIYGPSGCGKSHLINAIGVRTKQLFPQKRVLYISARLFQKQFTDAVRQSCVNDFISFYQTIDMLIVDDIQEWATADKTQDTFFHIFNTFSARQTYHPGLRPSAVDLKNLQTACVAFFVRIDCRVGETQPQALHRHSGEQDPSATA